jgi:hypothetical protein
VAGGLTIPAAWNGPPESANGGYSSGLLAQLLDAEVVEVTLRSPPPLERELRVEREDDHVRVIDGDTLVAEATPAELLLDVPDPVSPEEAAAASAAGAKSWAGGHPFPTCVVCGPELPSGDGMRLFPGALRDGMFATPWTPGESLSDGEGYVRPECVWAALDCPSSAPVAKWKEGPAMVLARLTARLGCRVAVGESCAILAWPLGEDGRKHHSAAALFDSEGRLMCAARALWIELRE